MRAFSFPTCDDCQVPNACAEYRRCFASKCQPAPNLKNVYSFNEYQHQAHKTAIFPSELGALYPALGLCGETGEVAEKIKKLYRDGSGIPTPEFLANIAKELGDVLWYLSELATHFDLPLDHIAAENLRKLASRQDRGQLQGNGDER